MKTVFVTPSYRGDFERCQLLCESTSRFLPAGVEHVLVIDRRDLPLFKPLQNGTVRIIEAEALLPWWIFRVPGLNGWRASLKSLPVRNWIFQQLLKIAAARQLNTDVVQFVDSDVTLIRPFDLSFLTDGDLVRLQHTPYSNKSHQTWLDAARRILRMDEDVTLSGNYIGNLITWRSDNVARMLDHIENRTGKSWVRAILGEPRFSEYMLYGAYVDGVIGLPASGHFSDSRYNLALCWNFDVRNSAGMASFFDSVSPESMGVMIHSKFGIPVASYRSRIELLWQRSETSAGNG